MEGRHDAFPRYDIYIGDQHIYGFNGIEAGQAAPGLLFQLDINGFREDQPGLITPVPFEGILGPEADNFDVCRSSNQNDLPSFCN